MRFQLINPWNNQRIELNLTEILQVDTNHILTYNSNKEIIIIARGTWYN